MKRPLQPFPRAPFTVDVIGTVPRVLDADGIDVMTLPGGPERLAACANVSGPERAGVTAGETAPIHKPDCQKPDTCLLGFTSALCWSCNNAVMRRKREAA